MPSNWETYKDWKQLIENISKPNIEFVDDDYVDDDVTDLTEMFREYID